MGFDYKTYKGHDLIVIYTGKTWTDKDGEERRDEISFGVKKAQAICDNIDAIRKFAERGDANENTPF